MIVCTRSLDAIARQAFDKSNVAISSVERMVEKFALDSAVSGQAIEAFLIADTDVRNKKVKQKFLTGAATKHPSVRIIYVIRGNKPDLESAEGVDSILQKPTPEALRDEVYRLAENITRKEDIISSAEAVPQGIESFKPQGLMHNTEVPTDEAGMPLDPEGMEQLQRELDAEMAPTQEEEAAVEASDIEAMLSDINLTVEDTPATEAPKESELIDRVKKCNAACDLKTLTKELTATNLIQDIVKDNAQYVNVESMLKATREKMLTIYADPSIPSQEERLDKIKALCYDKDKYAVSNGTVIEQRMTEIVSLVVDQAKKYISEETKRIDDALVNMRAGKDEEMNYTRLAGITDERANLILELQTFDRDIKEIFTNTHNFTMDTASRIAEENSSYTDSPLVNERLRLRGEAIVSKETRDIIMNVLTTTANTSEEFKEATRDIVVLQQKLNKLIDLDREQISALTQIIQYLRANNVEDTIIKESLIKKSLRVFVGDEGVGRTAVPYILSKLKSRENYNVLYVDITGKNKVADYGDEMYTLDEWMTNRYEQEYCGVAGEISDSVDAAQRFMSALVKAADYYRVINVVMSPDQVELFKTIAPDVLVINYLVDTSYKGLDFYKNFIKETKYPNVAQRVIINKCDIPVRPVLEKLDLIEEADVHVAVIPTVPAIAESSLNAVKPYELVVVQDAFREVRKVC